MSKQAVEWCSTSCHHRRFSLSLCGGTIDRTVRCHHRRFSLSLRGGTLDKAWFSPSDWMVPQTPQASILLFPRGAHAHPGTSQHQPQSYTPARRPAIKARGRARGRLGRAFFANKETPLHHQMTTADSRAAVAARKSHPRAHDGVPSRAKEGGGGGIPQAILLPYGAGNSRE